MSESPERDDRVAHGQHPRRVLLKLSGEVFGGGAVGLDPDVVADAAQQIAQAVARGVQVSVVVGGGNFFRGAELSARGMDRARADYMGMLGTVMNALALQDFIEKAGTPARVQTAIAMGQVAESYVPLRAPVAGIAMGLMHDEIDGQTRWATLTDILGSEDAFGDMDFKVAGVSCTTSFASI